MIEDATQPFSFHQVTLGRIREHLGARSVGARHCSAMGAPRNGHHARFPTPLLAAALPALRVRVLACLREVIVFSHRSHLPAYSIRSFRDALRTEISRMTLYTDALLFGTRGLYVIQSFSLNNAVKWFNT